MFVLHLRDGIGFPEYVGDLVYLRSKGAPELSQNQAVPSFSPLKSRTTQRNAIVFHFPIWHVTRCALQLRVSFYYYEESGTVVPWFPQTVKIEAFSPHT
jgi:hypothetical protein